MPKKKRGLKIRRAKPDDPIFTEGLQIYTPLWARPGYKPPDYPLDSGEQVSTSVQLATRVSGRKRGRVVSGANRAQIVFHAFTAL